MKKEYDIYKKFGRDTLVWFESAQTLHGALARIQQLAKHLPGTYMVRNQRTGKRHRFEAVLSSQLSEVDSSRPK